MHVNLSFVLNYTYIRKHWYITTRQRICVLRVTGRESNSVSFWVGSVVRCYAYCAFVEINGMFGYLTILVLYASNVFLDTYEQVNTTCLLLLICSVR